MMQDLQQGTRGEVRVTSEFIKARYGGVADMTIWRWLRHPTLGFPQPIARINGRRYWRLADLEEFDRRMATKAREVA